MFDALNVSQLRFYCREYDLMSVEPLFNFNMPELAKLLKSQAEQNPSASYFNVDILKVTSDSFSVRFVVAIMHHFIVCLFVLN